MSALLDRALDPSRKLEIARHDRTNGHVHPIFASMLDTFCRPAALQDIKREAYERMLRAHEWSFEFSDDASVYARGREQLAELRLVQREIDPDFSTWNQHCHPACRDGAAYQ
jgi:hypothetical protein